MLENLVDLLKDKMSPEQIKVAEESASNLQVGAMDYLLAWEEEGGGLRLQSSMAPQERLYIALLQVNGYVSKKFNGGDICYILNGD